MNEKLKLAFESEMAAAHHLARDGRLTQAFRHLERAHVLGQRHVVPHVRSHWAMLKIGIMRHSTGEIIGQAVRILIGALGSALGVVPVGNTGGANISMFSHLPIEEELVSLLNTDTHAS